MIVVVWLVLAVLLFLFELHHLAFYALFGAVGCLAGAGVAFLAPSALPLQAGAAVMVTGVGVLALRPQVSKAFASRHEGHVARGVHGGLLGQEALTLDVVGDSPQLGHVRLVGERWMAVSGSGERIPAHTTVLVTAVVGTTLTVWPIGVAGDQSAVEAGSSD